MVSLHCLGTLPVLKPKATSGAFLRIPKYKLEEFQLDKMQIEKKI